MPHKEREGGAGMIKKRTSLVFILPICLFLNSLYCTNSLSGGGIDIGNPTICVVDSCNRPVANASVKIISSDQWFANTFNGQNTISDSAVTNISGFCVLDSLAAGNYNLQVDHPSGGAFIANFHPADSETVNITIRNYGTIAGAISSASGQPALLRLAGTAYTASISSGDFYLLTTIAEGSYLPVIMAVDSQWTFIQMINVISAKTTVNKDEVSFNTLLIDDFEDSDSTMKIGRFVSGSYIYANYASSKNASALYQIVPEGFSGVNALKGTLIRNGVWALVGFFLGIKPDADSVWDFSSATGLSFYAKGTGKLNVSLESDSIDNMGAYKHYSADIVLQAQWRQFAISFDSLTFKADANPDPDITWIESARSIKRIEFNALEGGDTIQFWLDDLMINGLDFSAIY